MTQRQNHLFDPNAAQVHPTPAASFPPAISPFNNYNTQWMPQTFGYAPNIALNAQPLNEPIRAAPAVPSLARRDFAPMEFFHQPKLEPASTMAGQQAISSGRNEPNLAAGPTIGLKAVTLSFNSVAWQNRPARIYVIGEGIDPDNSYLSDLNNFPKYLVLTAPDQARLDKSRRMRAISPDGKEITIFNYHDPKREEDCFVELQVWRRGDSSGASPPRLLLDSPSPSLPSPRNSNLVWFEKMGFNKRELYVTINCEKGLRVQDLFVVGILKLGPLIFASPETSFPAPSSRRKNAQYPPLWRFLDRFDLVPRLCVYFNSCFGDCSLFSVSTQSESGRTPNSPPSEGHSSLAGSRTSLSGSSNHSDSSRSRSDSSARSHSSEGIIPFPKRRKLDDEEVDPISVYGWEKIMDLLQAQNIPSEMFQRLDALFQLCSETDTISVDTTKAEWTAWFDSVSKQVPDKSMVVSNILIPALLSGCFFGTLSANGSAKLLRQHGQFSPQQDAFLIRLSRSKRPYFGLDARFFDINANQHVVYNSNIFFEYKQDTKTLGFWLDTERDARPSYSPSLADVVEYVIRKTGWQPLNLDSARQFSMYADNEAAFRSAEAT